MYVCNVNITGGCHCFICSINSTTFEFNSILVEKEIHYNLVLISSLCKQGQGLICSMRDTKISVRFLSKYHSFDSQDIEGIWCLTDLFFTTPKASKYFLRRCFRYVFGVQIPPNKVFGSLGNSFSKSVLFLHGSRWFEGGRPDRCNSREISR